MFYDYLLQTFGKNEPIFVSDISYDGMTENNIRQQLMYCVSSGKLRRYDTGIYYIPEESIFKSGSLLSQNSVIEKKYLLADNDGSNHLHGGRVGFSHRVWTVDCCSTDSVTLSLISKDGEEGYPGNLHVKVSYTLFDNVLAIRYHAVSDADTPCNLTNHSYFNLSGHNSGHVLDQTIQIFAQSYTPTNAESIPVGTIAAVENTPMDLRKPVRIGEHIDDDFVQLMQGHGYDHNFVIDGVANTLRPAAVAHSEKTGITMQVHTTQPGVQLYTANFLAEGRRGKDNCAYGPRHAFCLETQHFPDSPNQGNFPSAILERNAEYRHTAVFSFFSE